MWDPTGKVVKYRAHRVAYAIAHGGLAAGVHVLHRPGCEDPRCVNGQHTYSGTPAANAHDRDRPARRAPAATTSPAKTPCPGWAGTRARPGAGPPGRSGPAKPRPPTTSYVDFDTARNCWPTDATRCHVSHVAADTESWEQRMAQAFEEMPEVVRYVNNQSLGFAVPYALDGKQHVYLPDFIACADDGHGPTVEVTGRKDKAKEAKTSTVRELWVPAVNNPGASAAGRSWRVTDPWDSQRHHPSDRAALSGPPGRRRGDRLMARVSKPTGPTPVEAVSHRDKRLNIPTGSSRTSSITGFGWPPGPRRRR